LDIATLGFANSRIQIPAEIIENYLTNFAWLIS